VSALGPQSSAAGAIVSPAPVVTPPGYRSAFDDGRINPLRGVGTPLGDAQMAAVWTDTVPRRLVTDEATGGIFRFRPPAAVAPSGDRMALRAADPSAPVQRSRAAVGAAPEAQATPPAVRVARDHRHVLAGTFASRSAADRAYATLAANGLPTRIGQMNRSSGTVYAVLAGPFADTDALVSGLRRTQAAGFTGAVTRR
jgi:cell division septation protein DedD